MPEEVVVEVRGLAVLAEQAVAATETLHLMALLEPKTPAVVVVGFGLAPLLADQVVLE